MLKILPNQLLLNNVEERINVLFDTTSARHTHRERWAKIVPRLLAISGLDQLQLWLILDRALETWKEDPEKFQLTLINGIYATWNSTERVLLDLATGQVVAKTEVPAIMVLTVYPHQLPNLAI